MNRCLASLARGALLVLLGAGCSSSSSPTCPPPAAVPAGSAALLGAECDPLVPSQCGFPFPSSVYLVDDPSTKTGKRVAFPRAAMPRQNGQEVLDPALVGDSDGFSPGATILTHLPGATVTGLPTQDTIPLSLTTASPTIVLDAETGQLVPHFAELDQSASGEGDGEQTFMIRPVVRLADARRYIVAIRRVVDASGAALAPTPVFQALRDGAESCDPSVALRKPLYADIFAKLAAAGIGKDDLQLAWDYTTASRENNTRWLLHMRDEALALVGAEGPAYTIESSQDNPNPHIWRRILGKMTVPIYTDKAGAGAQLVFDASGLPRQNGTAAYEFEVNIPNAATHGTPGAVLQNGHGLLGSLHEGHDSYLATIADEGDYVTVSVDLIGMASGDVDSITGSLVGDVGGFKRAVGRQHQGLLNSLLAMRLMKGRFVREPLAQIGGKSTIDPTRSYYRGDSQGGIFGTTYMAITTDVTRGLLGEPGAPYSLLLDRSQDFGFFLLLLKGAYQKGRNIQLLLGMMQMMWDRTEPDGYMPYIAADMLPGTPAHRVLINAAIGDHQVTPLGAHIIARAVNAKNLAPVNRTVFGIPDTPGPIDGSTLVEYSYHLKTSPLTNVPPDDSYGMDPHEGPRKERDGILQEIEFFKTGIVKAFCTGPCDPE